jgi:hypothetical protein
MQPSLNSHAFSRFLVAQIAILLFAGCGGSPSTHHSQVDPKTQQSDVLPDGQVLSEDIRKHLWDIEHLGFVIEATVFPKLKVSVNDGSLEYWTQLLAEDCKASVPGAAAADQETKLIAKGQANFQTTVFDAAQLSTGSRQQFLEWLMTVRQRYSECHSSMGLVKLTPDQQGLSGSWTTVWRLRVAGTSDSDPAETEIDLEVRLTRLSDDIATQQSWATAITVVSHQHMTAKQAFFAEVTESSGLVSSRRHDNWTAEKFIANTGGVYVTDYDQDGHLDVFVDDHADGNRLYHGNGDGTFQETTPESGIDPGGTARAWELSCWADLDNDGDDDLIVEDRLYENLGNGTFADITSTTNFPLTPAASYAVADYDLDGLLDVYVCHAGAYRVGQQQKTRVKWIDDGLGIDNVLLRNLGNWQFEDVTFATKTGANGSCCFTAVWLHANEDIRPDLFAINEFGVNSLLLNSADGQFEQKTVDPVFGGYSMGATTGDYNNDGHTDIYVANMYSKAGNRILANVDQARYPPELYHKISEGMLGSKLYSGCPDGMFETVPARDMFAYVGWAYGPTMADFDNDGWLDIYATAGFKSEERGKPDG